eukprot:5795393-Pyramimonas_sp.AAC.2
MAKPSSVTAECKETTGAIHGHGQCAARANPFRKWILKVYEIEFLSQGTGVLDVGCGRGELAFQLLNLNGVPVTGLDPRPLE